MHEAVLETAERCFEAARMTTTQVEQQHQCNNNATTTPPATPATSPAVLTDETWLNVIAEDAGLHVTSPRDLPSNTLKDHAAAGLKLRQHMDEHTPRHRCAVCACMCAQDNVHVCNASAPQGHRVAIPNLHLLRADGPKSDAIPRDGHTIAVLDDSFHEEDVTELCLWVDESSTVPQNRRPHTNMVAGTWVNVCKECMSALKGHSGCEPCVPPRSLARLDPRQARRRC